MEANDQVDIALKYVRDIGLEIKAELTHALDLDAEINDTDRSEETREIASTVYQAKDGAVRLIKYTEALIKSVKVNGITIGQGENHERS